MNVNLHPPIRSNTFFSAPLSAADPEIARAIELEIGRQRDEIELIASENIVSRAVLEAQGSVLTNKYAEGYPGQALLRRLPIRRHRRKARDRARLHPVRLPLRQRAAELGQPGQPGRVPCPDAAGRHVHGPRSRRRRPPHPRLAGQPVRAMVSPGPLRRRSRDPSHRHGRSSAAGARTQAEAHHRRRIGLCALLGFRALPRDLRRGRRLFHGRYRPFRRAGGGGRASFSISARPRRDHHDPQDAAGPARRHDPDQRRGSRQEDQLGDLPRASGRTADACDRRQGGLLP